ncbi:uncharacterized protein LOC116176662 [Photinus pyralis]|uniref:uncharacterized protein LOC116170446 n=1 Tax=Photinus pyralis TaxID=7054 RepID=UPI0012676DE4|nr:uncharacterized protein LOC116170446 [Photinus pyralis]XP_031351245.1 uncharacterized protein LOC116176662 [Photinus pyralis]
MHPGIFLSVVTEKVLQMELGGLSNELLTRVSLRELIDVSCIEQFLEIMKEKLERTSIFQISGAEILEVEELLQDKKIQPLPNTMKLHQVSWISSNSDTLYLRELSCFQCRNSISCPHNAITPSQYQLKSGMSKKCNRSNPDLDKIEIGTAISVSKGNTTREENTEVNEISGKYKKDDWVAVVFDDQWYPGQVLYADGNSLEIKFMTRSKRNFMWPQKADVQKIPQDGVLCPLKVPTKLSSRVFKFENSDSLNSLMESLD